MRIKIENFKPRLSPLPPELPHFSFAALLATWGGVGRLRPAPGTLGSLAALPFGYLIVKIGGISALLIAILILMILGTLAARLYGQKSGVVDDQSIVIDEVLGIWMAALPAEDSALYWLLAFILFRIFDIYKPWPASFFDRRSRNSFDVMMDDVIAGLYAFIGVASFALRDLLVS